MLGGLGRVGVTLLCVEKRLRFNCRLLFVDAMQIIFLDLFHLLFKILAKVQMRERTLSCVGRLKQQIPMSLPVKSSSPVQLARKHSS